MGTLVATDTFTGTNGAAWSANWASGLAPSGGSATIQGNAGRMVCGTTGGYAGASRVSQKLTITNPTDVVFQQRFRFVGDEVYPALMIRATLPTLDAASGYFLSIDQNGNYAVVRQSGYTNLDSPGNLGAGSFSLVANTWYWVIYGAVGSAIKAVFWQDGNPVPSAYALNITDTTFTGAGDAGWSVGVGNTGLGKFEIDDVTVFDTFPVLGSAGPSPQTRSAAVLAAPAPQPFLASSRGAAQVPGGPPAFIGPGAGRPALGSSPVMLFRSVADVPPADILPRPSIARPVQVSARAALPVLAASRAETVALEPPTLAGVAASLLPRPAPVPLVRRSTADPVVTADTPTAILVSKVTVGPTPPAPGTAIAASRDVTPLQPSSNPAAAILGRATWSTAAPPSIVTRPTADSMATDSPPRPLLARASSPAYAAPVPSLAGSRDITAPQLADSPVLPVVGRALWAAMAPSSLLWRQTAASPDIPPIARPVTAPAVRLSDLARVLSWRAMPPAPVERRTDGVLLLAPQRPAGAARAWLLAPRAEPSMTPPGGTLTIADRATPSLTTAARSTPSLTTVDRATSTLTEGGP